MSRAALTAGLCAALAALAVLSSVGLETISPVLPLVAVAVLIAAAIAYTRPLLALYVALALIPLELFSIDVGGAFGLTPTEGLFVITAAVWVMRRVIHRQPLIMRTPAIAPLALLVFAVLPGLLVAVDQLAVVKQLAMWTVFLVLYLMITAEGNDTTVRNIFIALSVAAAACAVVAIYDSSSTAVTLIDFGAVAEGRATGTFSHPSQLGLFLSLVVPLQAALAFRGPAALHFPAAIGIALSLVAIALSLSRGAFLALAAAIVVLLLWKPFRRAAAVAVVAVACLSLIGLNPLGPVVDVETVTERIGSSAAATQADPRIELWRQTPAMIADHPLFGVGADNFQARAVEYGFIEPRTGGAQGHAHNLPLNVAAELGIVGLAALLWAGFVIAANCLRALGGSRDRTVRAYVFGVTASLACLAFYGLTDYPLSSNMLTGTLFALVGCSAVLAPQRSGARRPAVSPARPGAWAAAS